MLSRGQKEAKHIKGTPTPHHKTKGRIPNTALFFK
jgi:hypothetical protein